MDPDPDFWIRIQILSRSGSRLRNKVRSGSGQKDPDPKHWTYYVIQNKNFAGKHLLIYCVHRWQHILYFFILAFLKLNLFSKLIILFAISFFSHSPARPHPTFGTPATKQSDSDETAITAPGATAAAATPDLESSGPAAADTEDQTGTPPLEAVDPHRPTTSGIDALKSLLSSSAASRSVIRSPNTRSRFSVGGSSVKPTSSVRPGVGAASIATSSSNALYIYLLLLSERERERETSLPAHSRRHQSAIREDEIHSDLCWTQTLCCCISVVGLYKYNVCWCAI